MKSICKFLHGKSGFCALRRQRPTPPMIILTNRLVGIKYKKYVGPLHTVAHD